MWMRPDGMHFTKETGEWASGPRAHDPARDTDVTVLPRSVRHAPPVIPTHVDPVDRRRGVRRLEPRTARRTTVGVPLMIASADGATAVDGGRAHSGVRATRRCSPRSAATPTWCSSVPARHGQSTTAYRSGQTSASRSSAARSTIDWSLAAHAQRAGADRDDADRGRRCRRHPRDPLWRGATSTSPQHSRELHRLGVRIVMAEGGPSINGQLIAHDLVDELALTLSPRPRRGHFVTGRARRDRPRSSVCRSCTSSRRTARCSCDTWLRRRGRGRSAWVRCSCAAA